MNKNLQEVIKSIRVFSVEQVETAKSGHPGTPLGAAPVAATLFGECMKISPNNPKFPDRDRFVLSSGHASAMLYATLHVCGYDVPMSALRSFRQMDSLTSGHPEIELPGVDCSTGALGQGIANAVGMALSEKILAAKFNQPDCTLVDHYTYAFCGDGCMMEGIENEAASLAAVWKLGKLIVFYDSNRITIEGSTDIAFTEDVGARHDALGWQVLKVNDGEDVEVIKSAVEQAKAEREKPTLIIISSTIGFGAPMAGTSTVHGTPLGEDGLRSLKEKLGWTCAPFETPDSVKAFACEKQAKGLEYENAWQAELDKAKTRYPEVYKEYTAWMNGDALKEAANSEVLLKFTQGSAATRNLCGEILSVVDKLVPNLTGGSADLAPSNCTAIKGKEDYSPATPWGRALHFGIREHAMGAICNGIALHGGLIPFCATFFIFSDYMKYAVRMAAMMKLPVTYILSHDSIGVGEDGPTHQPVEQLASLRSIPGTYTFRPCDGVETASAFSYALERGLPTAIVTSRQKMNTYPCSTVEKAKRGGYVFSESDKSVPDCILMASGSEVDLCMQAQAKLKEEGIAARVVSMPCMELFDEQDESYKESVLPKSVRTRVAVEAASSMCWGKYVGLDGEYICLDHFGESAPAQLLFEKYGFTVDNIIKKVKCL